MLCGRHFIQHTNKFYCKFMSQFVSFRVAGRRHLALVPTVCATSTKDFPQILAEKPAIIVLPFSLTIGVAY